MSGAAGKSLDGLANTVLNLALDAVAAEVVQALRARGLEPIVLKGPTLAGWLHTRDETRRYRDIDLLVDPAGMSTAEAALAALGFRAQPILGEPQRHQVHARAWRRDSDGATIDLHRTLSGVQGVSPAQVWRELQPHRDSLTLGGIRVTVLDEPARTLLIALHVYHHRLQEDDVRAKPLNDLRAAADRVPEHVWSRALELAGRLHAREAVGVALGQVDGGSALAERLGIPVNVEPATGTRALLGPGFERLAEARGRERVRLVAAELMPSPEYLRWSSPLARRGRRGLAAAYLERPLWLAWHAVPSYLAWRRSRRDTYGPG